MNNSALLKSLDEAIGRRGRYRVSAGETATGDIYQVKGITASTYDTGCVARIGDAPAADETVADGESDFWPASTVVVKTGSVYVYGENVSVS